jgi:2-dehydro-3-deoxy-D-arabinonate dehydratase
MRYYRYPSTDGDRLVVEADDGRYDLTAVKPDLRSFGDLARAAAVTDAGVDEVAERLLDRAPSHDGTGAPRAPEAEEVWAAGVTYGISEQAREAESGMPEMYLDVYEAERPEVFFKATPGRTVGPGGAIGVRGDADWNVPEPELGVVLHRGEIVGYTVGNDVSSRDIEGANPLYLPQAKVYDRCCSLGPCVASPGTVGDPHDLAMSMTIERDSEHVFEGSTSTGEMVRSCEELVSYYTRHNAVPERAVLLTGTSIVPPDEFTLRAGDSVSIEIENVGALENSVVTV